MSKAPHDDRAELFSLCLIGYFMQAIPLLPTAESVIV